MANQTRAVWEAELPEYIDDNTTENISPEDVRYILTNLKDSVPWKQTDKYVRIATTTTGTNELTVTLTGEYPTSYNEFIPVIIQAAAANTGTVTVNLNSLGAKDLVSPDGEALAAGELAAGEYYMIKYEAAAGNFRIFRGFGGACMPRVKRKQITAAYTVTNEDSGLIIECTGTFTVTFPNGLDADVYFQFVNLGTGAITFAATTTMLSRGAYTRLSAQYDSAFAYHRGSNIFHVTGLEL